MKFYLNDSKYPLVKSIYFILLILSAVLHLLCKVTYPMSNLGVSETDTDFKQSQGELPINVQLRHLTNVIVTLCNNDEIKFKSLSDHIGELKIKVEELGCHG